MRRLLDTLLCSILPAFMERKSRPRFFVVRWTWCGPTGMVSGLEDGFYSKKQAAGLFLLASRMGLSYHLAPYDETSDLVSLVEGSFGDPTAINYIGVVLSHYEDFVYDLETESHHFGVMPGNLVVHNTDSVMVKFPACLPRKHTNCPSI